MAIDVTDATFQTEVLDRSNDKVVVVDLWAPWCGPCRTLGPIIEKVCDETDGAVVLTKVNIDENPGIAQAFGVQSIPLVVALKDGQPVDGFLGAQPEHTVREWVQQFLPSQEQQELQALIAAGDEASLRAALELAPGEEAVIVPLARVLVEDGRSEEALELLNRVPETEPVRLVAAQARLAQRPADDYDAQLTALLDQVKADEDARRQYLDILEVMGPDDPRTAGYRKQLTSRLF
jgi:putative thioredoxin